MSGFVFEKDRMFQEFEEIYSKYPSNVEHLYKLLDEMDDPAASPYYRKSLVYQVAAEHCEVRLMPSCPFYSEIDTGRERNSVTSSWPPVPGIACWFMAKNKQIEEDFRRWVEPFDQKILLRSSFFVDFAHSYANSEKLIELGFLGIKEEAVSRIEEGCDAEEEAFLQAVMAASDAACRIAERFADKAEELLQNEQEEDKRQNLLRIAKTARRVPKHPSATFYEALNTFWFAREICNALEGLGFAVLGHLDKTLYPFYKKDMEEGRITRAEAQEYIDCLISLTDARWDLNQFLDGGTNATVVIGGCDGQGVLIYNDITEMVIESFVKYRFANPKLQARISSGHSDAYYERLAHLAALGTNVLSIFNDEVIIGAQVKAGKPLNEARLYLAGGCQEPMLQNELNSRAYCYLNLAHMLDVSLFKEDWQTLFEKEGARILRAETAKTFEEFYRRVLYNFSAQMLVFVRAYNRFHLEWVQTNPCPLCSSMMNDCIENAMDISMGGARLNADSFSMTGIGTMVDSLFAIKKAVYDDAVITMDALKTVLKENYEGHEDLRQYLLNKIPKLGHSDKEVQTFTDRVLKDIAKRASGFPNARGGYFEASLFTFYAFDWFKNSRATADGRKKGMILSRGVNPSETTKNVDAATLLYTESNLDYTDYPGGAILYMELPVAKTAIESRVFEGVLRQFIKMGGDIMDFNVVDKKKLIEAQKHPDTYRNIVVRVCGYSALFHSLGKEMQDEIIARVAR